MLEALNERSSVQVWVPLAFGITIIGEHTDETLGVRSGVFGRARRRIRSVEVLGLFGEFSAKVGSSPGRNGATPMVYGEVVTVLRSVIESPQGSSVLSGVGSVVWD